MAEDSRPRYIGDGRGAGEAKAAVERQPRRGMFDGFRPRPPERTGERTAEPVQGAKEKADPKRGMFDGLKVPSRTTATKPAKETTARAEQGHTHGFSRAVEPAWRSAEGGLLAHASGGPVLEIQKLALERTE